MSWMLKTVLVLTINSVTGVSEHNHRFSVKNYSSADINCWEFIIRDVWRGDSGDVSCGVQEKPIQTAQLFVQGWEQFLNISSLEVKTGFFTGIKMCRVVK